MSCLEFSDFLDENSGGVRWLLEAAVWEGLWGTGPDPPTEARLLPSPPEHRYRFKHSLFSSPSSPVAQFGLISMHADLPDRKAKFKSVINSDGS